MRKLGKAVGKRGNRWVSWGWVLRRKKSETEKRCVKHLYGSEKWITKSKT